MTIKAIAIGNKRPDLFAIQQRAFNDHLGLQLLSAGHPTSIIEREILLPDARWEGIFPEAFLEAVGMVVEGFRGDGDLLIVEGDIWPTAEADIADWPNLVMRNWAGRPYPGIMFLRQGRDVFPFWRHLDEGSVSALLRTSPDLLLDWAPYGDAENAGVELRHAELIGGAWIHYNAGDRSAGIVGKAPLPGWFYARKKICRECNQADCMMKKLSGCQRGARLKRPGMVCPEGKWGTESGRNR